MPTNYDGIPGNVVAPPAINIASSTNANPIAITVSGALPADFFTGIKVHVDGHLNNANANGIWTATVTGASTFTIPVAGSAVGGATGTVQPLNMTPKFTYPSDGDLDNQASISTWAQATGDRDQYLASLTGRYKLADRYVLVEDSMVTTGGWATKSVTATASTWYQITGNLTANIGTPLVGLLGSPFFGFGNVCAGDIAHATLRANDNTGITNPFAYGLWYESLQYSVSPSFGSSTKFLGSSSWVNGSGGNQLGVYVDGWVVVPNTGALYITPAVWSAAITTAVVWKLDFDAVLCVDIWRPTGFPQ